MALFLGDQVLLGSGGLARKLLFNYPLSGRAGTAAATSFNERRLQLPLTCANKPATKLLLLLWSLLESGAFFRALRVLDYF